MPSQGLVFKDAEAVRDAICESQKKEIAKLYEEWANEIGERAEFYKTKTTASSELQRRQMLELQKQLKATGEKISNEVYKGIKSSIYDVSSAVVRSNVNWMRELGFPEKGISIAFTNVPDQTVRKLVTGQLYESGWSLSKAIWSDNEKTMRDAYQIVAKGMAQNSSTYDIAKQLEQYVSPSAKMPWNYNITYKDAQGNSHSARLYKGTVDYNAQRLARTLAQHSYQSSLIAVTRDNPFVEDFIWRANGSRVCPLCASRDGKHFAKDQLPLDHPNGMCVFEPNIPSMQEISDKLADWVNSEDGTYPEIDSFAKHFGYKAEVKNAIIERHGVKAATTMAAKFKEFGDMADKKTEIVGKVDFGNVHKEGRIVEYAKQYKGTGKEVADFFGDHSNYKELVNNMSASERKAFKDMWSRGKFMKGQQYGSFVKMSAKEQQAIKIFDKYLDQTTLDASVKVVRLSDAQLVLGAGNREGTLEALSEMKGKQIVCDANMSFSAASEGLRIDYTSPAPTVEYTLKIPQGSDGAGMYIGDSEINIWGNKQREFMTNRNIWMTVDNVEFDTARGVYKVELNYGGLMEHVYK